MTQEELREAVFEALLDYETFKKTRRLKALKKALQGTMVATMIGSTGLMAAGQGRSNQVRETSSFLSSNPNVMSAMTKLPQEDSQLKVVPGAAYFAVNQHSLAHEDEDLLMRLVNQFPKDAELTIVGCTDAIGGTEYNKKLGTKRARAVAGFLERQGFKVKKITNLISQNKRANWLARRVDIIVDSSMLPFAANVQPHTAQYSVPPSHPKLDQQKPWQGADNLGIQNKASQATDKAEVLDNTKSIAALPKIDAQTTRVKPDQQVDQRQLHLVLGVTHYALNSHILASAHKERLMELIKQLPKDAELTVIGRADSQGIRAFNKNLGMLRAKSVANFLASQGVKIKAVGSKLSSGKYSDWMARRVDIVIDSAQTPLDIVLPPPVPQENSYRTESPRPKPRSTSAIDGKRAVAIEKDVTRSIGRARSVYNGNPDEQTFSDNPEWWDDGAKANKSCLENSSLPGDTESCLPKTSPK